MSFKRARVVVTGAVQGVGFRPFVYRLAHELQLAGWVSNSTQGVLIEVQGTKARLDEFLARLETDKPQLAIIQRVQHASLAPTTYDQFEIRDSDDDGKATALILPDIATCKECRSEVFDPKSRRYLYPFTNCTQCGPRFSIIEALPYDRGNTSMKEFVMCAECEREYHDPRDRRFHAQPNACPGCGPRLALWDGSGRLCGEHDALLGAAAALREGRIVAVKGIGGFQLMVDARNEQAVRQLRTRKRREEKPFAVMFPSIDAATECCRLGELERQLLLSAAAPIVVVRAGGPSIDLAASVAPGNPWLGVMVPYSPLHHLLLDALRFPVVATSGNASDEPICTDEREALERLKDIADLFLVHDRPIVRHVDDSVVRVMAGREMVLRRARGCAPLPIVGADIRSLGFTRSEGVKPPHVGSYNVLAVGAHLKNTVALSCGGQVFMSQHIGDLETEQACAAFQTTIADLPRLYDASPDIIAHDLHPEYFSTRFAHQLIQAKDHSRRNPRPLPVQHHYAHVLSCMADNGLSGPALGVAWDGTGLGTDGTIWGGEFLRINERSFERIAHLRQFCLPGGDAAVRQPRRCAMGLLYEIFGAGLFERADLLQQFSQGELRMLERMLAGGINSPVTSSAGRFFDAVASIVGLRQRVRFEGQAAMDLEFAIAQGTDAAYPIEVWEAMPAVFDWQPVILGILEDLRHGVPVGIISAKVHNTLVEYIAAAAYAAGETTVVLSGGCFQNQYLTERTICRLRAEGFTPYWHHRVPANDGGIALGQIAAALLTAGQVPGAEPDGQEHPVVTELPEPALKS